MFLNHNYAPKIDMKISKPFVGASPTNITQLFSSTHDAIDVASRFGTFLVAPFDCVINNVVSSSLYANPQNPATLTVQNGCGISMTSKEDPTIRVVYWHCLFEFPVVVGQSVKQGKPVAQMGNTGMVTMGGVPVTVGLREQDYAQSSPTNLNEPGTHVHLEVHINGTPVDPLGYIDWTITVKPDILTAIKQTLFNISQAIKWVR